MKTILLILAAGAAVAVGAYFRAALSRRAVILRQMRYALDEILLMIRYKNETVAEIFHKLSEDSRLSELTFIQTVNESLSGENSGSFREIYSAAVENFTPPGLIARDKEIIGGIGQVLGVSNAEGQAASLSVYKAELETAYNAALDNFNRKSKLCTSLGLLAGAFIIIVLI
jgi:stage III sporulation protein AB